MRAFKRSESGFAMVEVMVSAVLLIILAMATLKVIDGSAAASGTQRARSIASNIAHADLNRLRQITVPKTGFTQTSTQVVNGISYTVTSDAQWASDSGGVLTCSSGSGAAQYLRTSSSVSWTGMGNAKPIVAESIVTPRVGEMDPTLGSLAVLVKGALGNPQQGITVTAGGQSGVTDATGCVVIPRIAAGSYDVSYYRAGYVAEDGSATGIEKNVSILAGQTSLVQVAYDVPATLSPVAFNDETGATKTPTFSGLQQYAVSNTTKFWKTYSTTGANGLFPFASGYAVYAGTCRGNDPTLYDNTFSTTSPFNPNAFPRPTPGQTVAATAYVRSMTFQVKGGPTSATGHFVVKYDVSGSTPMVRPAGEIACDVSWSGSGIQALANVGPTSQSKAFDLPYGLYSICFDNGTRKYTRPSRYTSATAAGATYKWNPPNAAYVIDVGKTSGGVNNKPDGVDAADGGTYANGVC